MKSSGKDAQNVTECASMGSAGMACATPAEASNAKAAAEARRILWCSPCVNLPRRGCVPRAGHAREGQSRDRRSAPSPKRALPNRASVAGSGTELLVTDTSSSAWYVGSLRAANVIVVLTSVAATVKLSRV